MSEIDDHVEPVNAVEMYTDGSCLGNPGPGGWGVVLRWNGTEKELSGSEEDTTNNRMELLAAIRGLETLTRPVAVKLYTDSQYVKNGIESWIHNWKRNGWKTSAKKPVKNEDLWKLLDEQIQRHVVSFHWVKGHAGHPENERADDLAREAAEAVSA